MMAEGEHSIVAQMRQGCVAATVNGQVNFICSSHVVPSPNSNMTGRQLRVHVLTQNVRWGRVGQHAGGHHSLGSAWNALFTRLEDAPDRSMPAVARGLQQLHSPQQRCGVHVMPAGVHHTWLLGGVGNVICFMNGQGVHVCSKRDKTGVRILSLNRGHDPCVCDMGFMFNAPTRKLSGNKGHGFVLLERQFRVGMKVASQFDPLLVMFGRKGVKML